MNEISNPNATPEVEAPQKPTLEIGDGEPKAPLLIQGSPSALPLASKLQTTPDTANGRVRLHMELYEVGKAPVIGGFAVLPQDATRLGRKLIDDAAFVRKHGPKKQKSGKKPAR